jgi:hypothetical protein
MDLVMFCDRHFECEDVYMHMKIYICSVRSRVRQYHST